MHRSLQSISDTMLAMKRGLDSITGKSDENKRAKISLMQADNADDGSSSTSDVKDIVDTYLQTCQPGGPQKGTIRGKKPIWPIASLGQNLRKKRQSHWLKNIYGHKMSITFKSQKSKSIYGDSSSLKKKRKHLISQCKDLSRLYAK